MNEYAALILDDDETFLCSFSAGLRRAAGTVGITLSIVTALTPFSALQALRREKFDILFIDYFLNPHHDGAEVVDYLEREPRFAISEKYIVLMSAQDESEFADVFAKRCVQYGEKIDYLRKPVSHVTLVSLLARVDRVLSHDNLTPLPVSPSTRNFVFATANEREGRAVAQFMQKKARDLGVELAPEYDDIIPRQALECSVGGNISRFLAVRADNTGGLDAQDLFRRIVLNLAADVVFFVGCASLVAERIRPAANLVFVARSAIDYEQREVRDDGVLYDLMRHSGDASIVRNIEMLNDNGEFADLRVVTRKDFISGHAFFRGERSELRLDILNIMPPDAVVVEMESFAIFKAFHNCRIENGSVSIAVVKGISDLGDSAAQEDKETRQMLATSNSMTVAWRVAMLKAGKPGPASQTRGQ
ncbi:response regulator [Thiohalocapsa sp. ML1]|jgi:CheY-like chemotaxis protein|uniref:response regulator n=1 Tax=Thiohalocapsa sp. ML1 TaxID=1431688 RepID=UPI0009E79D61|nr:response regulator [Thiohalocapsa sp. ML1]